MQRGQLSSMIVENIYVAGRARALNDERVKALAESIKAIGLQTPISVVMRDDMVIDGQKENRVPVLVAGAHRLAAAKLLGWEMIEAWVIKADDLEAQLWEIDENLARSELTQAEAAIHTTRRAEVWAKMRETGGKNFSTSLKDGRGRGPQHQKAFAADTAEKTGKTKQTINTALARGRKIAPDVLEQVQGTALDKGVELDALAKLSHEEQRERVKEVKAGKATTVRVVPNREEIDVAALARQDVSRRARDLTVSQLQAWADAVAEEASRVIKSRLAA